MKHTAILVDDEHENNLLLSHFIKQYCPEVEILAVCSSFSDAFGDIKRLNPEILFLDITLGPNEDAFQLLKLLGDIDSKIIFITAHHEFALQAFRFSAIDYLLKPIKIDELVEAVNKVIKLNKPQEQYAEKLNLLQTILLDKEIMNMTHNKTINIPIEDKIEFWQQKDILMVEARLKDSIVIDVNGNRFNTTLSIGDFENTLDKSNFLRVHKSFIINKECVISVSNGSNLLLNLLNGTCIKVARRKKSEVLSVLKIN
jgi:two-component system LytT family response regulator